MEIDIGIKEKDRAKIAEGLSRLLADSYTLYLTTHNCCRLPDSAQIWRR